MAELIDRLSLSTCWCSARHTDGYEMVEEMVGLGFKRIELSHGIRISLVPGILTAVEEGLVEISSVHNFCPLPNSVQHAAPNLYQPSSYDSREQTLWKKYSAQTFDFAVKVGAKKVVMHSGSVWFFFSSPEDKLDKWMDSADLDVLEMAEDKAFQKRRDRALKKIRRHSKKALGRVLDNYAEVLPLAAERGLTLGIENREGLEELPLDEGHGDFIQSLSDKGPVGYWHDAGHAEIKAQFGLLDHRKRLEELSERLVGFHLHDVSKEGRDHRVPGSGVIDFKMIAEFVRPEHTLVLELSPSLSRDEVLRSRDYIGSVLQ
ncbi:sugar phosphate isomerase/epimerase family protein [Coraliomargarita parva]|uniref:sugar phosphate isomerase/epimerase family protein n=1 Tax=Coraliomargarita parva TaxID=3014050 RepID=UPI0022B32415|nr:TIM barrel protein [Coraliomargarita parva]